MSNGGLVLQGRQVVGVAQPKHTRGMPVEVRQLGHGRQRSRDQGTMSGGLNGDLSEPAGKGLQQHLTADPSTKAVIAGAPVIGRKLHEAVGGFGAQREQDEGRPGESSFETKRRSELQGSQPEPRPSGAEPTAGPYQERDVDKASSSMSKTGRVAKNALAV